MSESFRGGQEATLFPINKKVTEDQATSIFFSVFDLVLPFRETMLKSIGQRSFKRGNDYSCVLRPCIGGRITDMDIPDALISLTRRGESWRALVEVKIGSASLDQAQLGRYLNRAISEKVDCLITISNEMCISPDQPPLRLKPAEKRLRKIPHFHWSWRFIEHLAKQCLKTTDLRELETKILTQFIELLEKESGIHGFRSMPACWPKFVDTLRDGGRPTDEDKEQIISGWLQEASDISIILSDIFDGRVEFIHDEKTLELRRKSAEQLLDDEADLSAKFEVLDNKIIIITVDINSRFIKFETNHLPTTTVKSSHKQVERFLNNFRDSNLEGEWGGHSDVRLFARWKRQRRETDCSMQDAMVDLKEDTLKQSKLIMRSKELSLIRIQYTPSGASGSIRSSKKFIEFVENQVRFFAETYVQK